MRIPLSHHLVLADDDPDHAFLFKKVLQQVDPSKRLITVQDGNALLQLLADLQPEILFLDLKMPCKNGHDCLKEIRSNPDTRDMKVVVYSSSCQMADIRKSYAHKADLYLVKPFITEHLVHALEAVLKKDWPMSFANQYHYFINNKFVPFTAQG